MPEERFRDERSITVFFSQYCGSQPTATWLFALAFGFAMGADYLLIPLITAACFGTAVLGKILALIIMG